MSRLDTNVSEDRAASVFRMEDEVSIDLRNVGIQAPQHKTQERNK
jgi:hypothetical protein